MKIIGLTELESVGILSSLAPDNLPITNVVYPTVEAIDVWYDGFQIQFHMSETFPVA